ncbi:MAG: AsmA family protein, partial [Candidatus Omnitrophica bacterium]|nr:AsmA family protein [Candidatus Omnitrophota bacterium]
MKKFRKSLLIILVVLFLLFLGKNVIIKAVVSQGVKAATGLKLNIEKMRVGVFNSRIDIKALTLFNPQQFEDKVMVKIPEIYVDYKLLPFFKQKIYLEEVRLNLNEFIVIKDKDGNVNLDSLKVIKEQKSPQKKAKDKKTMDFQIDK